MAQIDDSLRGSTRYHYDASQRLTQVQDPNPEVFIHDPAGNLLADSPATQQGQQAPGNRLNLFGDAHFSYDAYGNRSLQARGKQGALKTHYQYNALNQLTAIAVNGAINQYAYDPLGRRISKRSADKSCEFLWLGDQLLAERSLDATGAQLSAKTYLFKPNSFEPIAFVQNDGIYYYHLDHLGTPQEITNQNGELVWAVSYKAYGNLAVAFKAEVENNLRFAGQYFDEESGLHYNRFRYYDPACGRFINQDPIGLLGGVNNYLYVPNPTGWVDPLGLTPKDCNRDSGPDFYVGPAGPSATLPATAYRYDRYLNDDGTPNEWGEKIMQTKQGQVTYFGFEKYDTGAKAADAFQIKTKRHVNPLDPDDSSWSDSRLRSEFDTLQLFDDKGVPKVRVPSAFGDRPGAIPEPFTSAYPEYGKGGAQQLHADKKIIKYNKTDILPEE